MGPAIRVEVGRCRHARTLPDGTRLRRGDRIGMLHLNNESVAALHVDGLQPHSAALHFRRQFVASLRALAALVEPPGPLSDVRAFAATTIFHRGMPRLGFQPEQNGLLWPGLVAAYQRALLASLHPDGALRLERASFPDARRLWLTRDELLARFGRPAGSVTAGADGA